MAVAETETPSAALLRYAYVYMTLLWPHNRRAAACSLAQSVSSYTRAAPLLHIPQSRLLWPALACSGATRAPERQSGARNMARHSLF
jgi:hypothetical protein